nr:acetylxylan esterase [Bacteroidales bacterium]
MAKRDLQLQRPTSDTKFAKPLAEVLKDIEEQFSVKLRYSKNDVNGVMLKYAEYRYRPWSVEETLDNVLKPLDLKFVKQKEAVYEIKPFEYARRLPEDGEDILNYLQTIYADKASWEARRAVLQKELRENAGLNGLPAAPASKPIFSKKRIYGDYYVQNFALEILPGVYCTGSMYHPLKYKKASCPIVLNPNGHFGKGRYRYDHQVRCAMQAKMGCIAVSYDLFSWDEQLLQFEPRAHRTAMAHTIQSLNAIRLLDYLCSLREADTTRVGITGGSGGGSQTMFITAIDDRITLSIPVVMTSSYFVGGCPCESGNPIHLSANGTNNAEIAAMCAPRPMLIVSDGKDWTKDVPWLEFPFIQRTYAFYAANELVENAHFPKEGHDYGPSKRQAAYAFMAKHWQLKCAHLKTAEGLFDESSCVEEDAKLLKVWGENGENLPDNALKGIENLYRLFHTYGQ